MKNREKRRGKCMHSHLYIDIGHDFILQGMKIYGSFFGLARNFIKGPQILSNTGILPLMAYVIFSKGKVAVHSKNHLPFLCLSRCIMFTDIKSIEHWAKWKWKVSVETFSGTWCLPVLLYILLRSARMERWPAKMTQKLKWNVHVENLDNKKADTSFFSCVLFLTICSWHLYGDAIKVISAVCSVLPLCAQTQGRTFPPRRSACCPVFTSPHVKHPLLLLTAHCARLSAVLRIIYGSTPLPIRLSLSLCCDDVIMVAVYCCLATGARWR